MKKRKTFIGLAIIVAVLTMTMGYAATTNQLLTINGTANAIVDTSLFNVHFTANNTFITDKINSASTTTVKAELDTADTKQRTVNIDVDGMSKKGDTVTVTLPVINDSTSDDLVALLQEIGAAAFTKGEDYYTVEAEYETPGDITKGLAKGETTNVIVTITLMETPVDEAKDYSGAFKVVFTAVPDTK